MKQVLITGASRGIGLEITKYLLKKNLKIYGLGRTIPHYTHPNFKFHKIDVNDLNSLKTLGRSIKNLDVLINNAGVGYFENLENLKNENIREMIHTNLLAPILLTKIFLKHLITSQGHLINIGSQSSKETNKKGTVYCASKFGLRGFTESLFLELRNKEVTVTLVNPGIVQSSFFTDKNFAPAKKNGCFLQTSDIAQVIYDIINFRKGAVIKEINIYPQKHSLQLKKI